MNVAHIKALEEKLAAVEDARRGITVALALLDDVLIELRDDLADARRAAEAAETDT